MSDPREIANQFDFPSSVKNVEPHGNGLINDTFVVSFSQSVKSGHSRLGSHAIMQRINPQVFPNPALIMENLALVLEHASRKARVTKSEFLLPPIYKSKQGEFSVKDDAGDYWRAIGFIENTVATDVLQNIEQARQAGIALGAFHQMMADLPAEKLKDTLPGFHDTPSYLKQFDSVVAELHSSTSQDTNESRDFCFKHIDKHRPLARLLVDAQPPLKPGIMHGDPKLNNILFDQQTGEAISIIDLDTVKPGFIHYDIGDCIRSCCNRAGEMPPGLEDVHFNIKDFEAILQGYLSRARELISNQDFDILYDVLRLLPFELGLRFFSDFLSGNQYFKVKAPEDNLYRACVQFKLLEQIESQASLIQAIIDDCRSAAGVAKDH